MNYKIKSYAYIGLFVFVWTLFFSSLFSGPLYALPLCNCGFALTPKQWCDTNCGLGLDWASGIPGPLGCSGGAPETYFCICANACPPR